MENKEGVFPFCSFNYKMVSYSKEIFQMEVTMGNDNACATCLYYVYDDEYEEYLCDMDMDEDEYVRLISDSHYRCPYYRNGDEYKVVRKQM